MGVGGRVANRRLRDERLGVIAWTVSLGNCICAECSSYVRMLTRGEMAFQGNRVACHGDDVQGTRVTVSGGELGRGLWGSGGVARGTRFLGSVLRLRSGMSMLATELRGVWAELCVAVEARLVSAKSGLPPSQEQGWGSFDMLRMSEVTRATRVAAPKYVWHRIR